VVLKRRDLAVWPKHVGMRGAALILMTRGKKKGEQSISTNFC